jgi:FdrA protein
MKENPVTLLQQELEVVNIGLELFAESLEQQGVKVAHVTWEPPAKGNPELVAILEELL